MSHIIAGDPAPTNPTALGEFVGCFGGGCQRGEWTAMAAERGWEQPAADEWLCPPRAANAADRADFVARKTIARDDLRDCFLSDSRDRFEAAADAYRAEVLAEQATGEAVHIFDAVYNALVSYSAQSHAFPALQYAHLRDELAQHLTASLLEAGIGGDTIVCDAEGCAIPCTPSCPNKTDGGESRG